MTGLRVAVVCGTVLVAAGCPSRSATAVSDLDVHRHAIVVDTSERGADHIPLRGNDAQNTSRRSV